MAYPKMNQAATSVYWMCNTRFRLALQRSSVRLLEMVVDSLGFLLFLVSFLRASDNTQAVTAQAKYIAMHVHLEFRSLPYFRRRIGRYDLSASQIE